ncbi:tetratricopeptide repeat protein [Streptomyces uncialis]|uniref:tetratricopeptide repeat protein n=1 Tax=Streptomyces uncialis TaxID=1048205 RepID=UPI0037FCDED2
MDERYRKALIHLDLGREETGERLLRELVDGDAEPLLDFVARVTLGDLLVATGRRAEARRTLTDALTRPLPEGDADLVRHERRIARELLADLDGRTAARDTPVTPWSGSDRGPE